MTEQSFSEFAHAPAGEVLPEATVKVLESYGVVGVDSASAWMRRMCMAIAVN